MLGRVPLFLCSNILSTTNSLHPENPIPDNSKIWLSSMYNKVAQLKIPPNLKCIALWLIVNRTSCTLQAVTSFLTIIFYILQGSVATCLRCGGSFDDDFTANLLPVKEFWKVDNVHYGEVTVKAKFHYAIWFEAGRRPACFERASNQLA